jgi:peptide deformylase
MLITVKTKNKNLLYEAIEAQSMNDSQIEEIGKKLANGLKKYGGIGLSANQIGEDWRVCLIDLDVADTTPLLLVNPQIKEVSKEKVVYFESCLSIPKTIRKPIATVRYKTMTITTDNLGEITFQPDETNWDTDKKFFDDRGLLLNIIAQHEIDHLDGVLITSPERRYNQPLKNNVKFGRNDKVLVKDPEGKVIFVKYKQAQKLTENGYTII